MDMMKDPMAQEGAAMEAAPEEAGYTICIRVGADGSLSVGVENEAAEAAEPAAPGAPEGEADEYASFRPAKDIKDALTQALAIYKADGQATADAQFDAGFSGQEGA